MLRCCAASELQTDLKENSGKVLDRKRGATLEGRGRHWVADGDAELGQCDRAESTSLAIRTSAISRSHRRINRCCCCLVSRPGCPKALVYLCCGLCLSLDQTVY